MRGSRSGKTTARYLLAGVSLTVAYAVAGKLGLLLAIPPGYASPVFPAAGIAVAAMLIGGAATLPWTFLGALLPNLWAGAGQLDRAGLAAAAITAAGSMAQGAVGGWALRRAVGYPAALDNGRDLTRFLLLCPVCCLTGATLSLGGLAALGAVVPADLPANWLTWWVGDTIGVLVVLPLMMVMLGEPRPLWRRRALPVALPMALFFALFVAIFVRVSTWESDQSLFEFRLLSQHIVDKVHSGLNEQELFLDQLASSFAGHTPLSHADFHGLVQILLRRFPMIQAVEWAPRIALSQRQSFEAAQQSDRPGFEICERGKTGRLRRAGTRPWYYPVSYVEPLRGNTEAVGFDLASDRDRGAAIAMTVAGGAAATAPIRLVQEHGQQRGMLLMVAVPGGANGAGVVLVVLRMGTFMDGLLAPAEATLAVRLVDADRNEVLYDGFPPGNAADFVRVFSFGGRRYRVETVPTPAYLARQHRWQSWSVLVVGVCSTGLLGALLMLATGYTRRIEITVEERTRDLQKVNRQLQTEMRERQQAEAALRQAQKLEAMGHLTGGIAHDFNNLLTVVMGNATLLHDRAADEPARRRAAAILAIVERGERLIRQLLAFSRRRTLRPEPVALQGRVNEIAEWLARSLREDIEVTIDVPEELWPVSVDPGEFELALLNIAVNARDAMPNGGAFRLEARNIRCGGGAASGGLVGEFVALTLSDTGTGMPAEVMAHAFDPYFTTKETGLGSGLGLSQVYGFASQSGGTAMIASRLGRGTAVTLLLPRAAGAPTLSTAAPEDPLSAPASARILVVEDDREVAEATRELLRDMGFATHWARNGEEALAHLKAGPPVDLVLSDVVMPGGVSGLDLARTLRERRPGLPVVLGTGYSRYAAQVVEEGFALIEKPYRRAALAASLRAALERARS
ncbi:MAG TPA: CHASE domain-containing protein [Stellaceae bacterium]|nr:CHASE domain-containing protein [Stellaceae bacterium]